MGNEDTMDRGQHNGQTVASSDSNNGNKTTRKSKSYEKIKSLMQNKDTTDRGQHHGQIVVSSGSTFFCSSLTPLA